MTSSASRTAAAYVALIAGHEIGDYWAQRDTDARDKGTPGPVGRAACARHVASYTAVQAVALAAATQYLRLGIGWRRAAVGLAVSAVTHYAADRCAGHWPDDSNSAPALVRFAHKYGKTKWLTTDPGAGALLDQAWHRAWIPVAAAIVGR